MLLHRWVWPASLLSQRIFSLAVVLVQNVLILVVPTLPVLFYVPVLARAL